MDSIENGATIRIGFKKNAINSDYQHSTYSLKINKKSVLNVSGGLSDEYLEIYENAAKEIAKIMNEKNIKEYVIYNGERVRFSNNAWVSCEYIPKDGEEVFKKTLIDCLDGVQ